MKFAYLCIATLFSACGAPHDDVSTLAAGPADLRFSGVPVQVFIPGANVPLDVAYASTFKVPCNTPGFRARYRYENAGQSGAAAHTNLSFVAGSATYPFAQTALPMSTLRYAFASFGAVTVPNVATKLAIQLDGPGVGAVAEASEANNTWVAKVIRVCP